MGVKVVKRDGVLVDFDSNKIVEAMLKAGRAIGEDEEELKQISRYISKRIEKIAEQKRKTIEIEEIQNLVVKMLKEVGFDNVSKAYQEYRERRTAVRELNGDIIKAVEGIINGTNEQELKENSNKKAEISQSGGIVFSTSASAYSFTGGLSIKGHDNLRVSLMTFRTYWSINA